MWLILGLLTALSATAFLEVSQSSSANAEDDDQTPDNDLAREPEQEMYGALLQELTDEDDALAEIERQETPLPVQDLHVQPDPNPGLFDELDERIHSADAFAPAQPPQGQLTLGTDGNDGLTGSVADDTLHGGEGGDQFGLGDWLAGHSPAVILNYSAEEDQILLYFDSAQIAAPEVTVTFSDTLPDTAEIRLEGHIVAHVPNAAGLSAGDIRLVDGRPDYTQVAAE